jgi:hypothetical protein
MPRYFFDFRDADGLFKDEGGQEMPGPKAARREAIRAVGGLALDIAAKGFDAEVTVEVRDHAGPVLEARAVIESRLLRRK